MSRILAALPTPGAGMALAFQPGPPPRETGRNYTASLTLERLVAGAGGQAKISIDLQTLPPGQVRNQVNAFAPMVRA
ncbi:hypothetical protein [Archangium sp.]|uniref:hypothetical protein n=1 Tax=Archangium sp. TaxID=1872627 RepID=UPI002D51F09E|nr:hypothetical protein [Archangium sp.]HYO57160.1 hypothetical protein [Archangium sp.]